MDGDIASSGHRIWYQDLGGFMSSTEALYSFIPLPNMSLAEQLNAILRFAIYYGVAVFIFQGTTKALLIPFVVAAITYGVFKHTDEMHKNETDAMQTQNISIDPQTKRHCTLPTKENPFMNILQTDYAKNPNRPAACDITRPSIRKKIDKLYLNEGLYNKTDTTDIFGRNTGMRQFYSNPSTTIPNDQGAFAKWLYNDSSINQRQKVQMLL